MLTENDTLHRHADQLAELAELGMALARDLQAEALAAATPVEKADCAQAFHSVARTIRQSIALEARLGRDDRREAVAVSAETVTAAKAKLRARVRGMVWNEAEASDCAALAAELDDHLSDAEHLPDFDAPLEAQIATLRGRLGLEPGVPPARRRTGVAAAGPEHVTIDVRFVDPTPGVDLVIHPTPPGARDATHRIGEAPPDAGDHSGDAEAGRAPGPDAAVGAWADTG